jgi:hypothetical protein
MMMSVGSVQEKIWRVACAENPESWAVRLIGRAVISLARAAALAMEHFCPFHNANRAAIHQPPSFMSILDATQPMHTFQPL